MTDEDAAPSARHVAARHSYLDAVTWLLVDALGDRLTPGIEDYLDLFAESGVLETPYAPHDAPRRIAGRINLAAFVESLRGYVVLADMRLRCRILGDDGHAVLEYDGTVRQPRRSITFAQSYVAVVRTDGGRVTLLREYADPSRAEAPDLYRPENT